MRLSDLTWLEVREYLQKNQSLLIPVGTCEQHGKHMPLNTDMLIAEYFADYLSENRDFSGASNQLRCQPAM